MNHAIIVTASYNVDQSIDGGARRHHGEHWITRAHREALRVFAVIAPVSFPARARFNDVRSFMIGPDGSKDNRVEADVADAARAKYIQWLRDQSYGPDEGSPLAWVVVQYGTDLDGETGAEVLAHADDRRTT